MIKLIRIFNIPGYNLYGNAILFFIYHNHNMINLELHFIINEFMATCPCPPTIKCEIYMNLYYVIKQM